MEKSSHFCSFYIDHVCLDHAVPGGMPNGFPSPRLAYIVSGECTCISEDGELKLYPGDVWSLPAKKGYKSIWKTDPTVDFYYMEYDADFFAFTVKNFKRIKSFNLENDFSILYNSKDNFERLSAFYDIIKKVSPFISEESTRSIDSVLPALQYIRNNYTDKIKVKYLAELCFMSESKFYSEFKKNLAISPIDYKNNLKTLKAIEMILHGITLEEICDKIGYSSPAFLRRQIKKYTGKTPKELKKSHNMI